MVKLHPIIRYAIFTLLVGAVAAIAYGVVGEFFIEWARETGWYENPSRRVENTMSAVREFVTQTWFLMLVSGAAGATFGIWLDHILRKLERYLAIRSQAAKVTIRDESAYNDLLGFVVGNILPACDARVQFHEALIHHFCADRAIAELAINGLRADPTPRVQLFWQHYGKLSEKLSSSPAQSVTFDELIEATEVLENRAYAIFCSLADATLDKNGQSINIEAHQDLRVPWQEWRDRHNALRDAYEPIKRDVRFQKLLRPVRESRWGARQ